MFRSKTAPRGLFQIGMLAFTAFVWCAVGLAEIVVTTTAELEAALTPANAGRRIRVRAGEYVISQALTVPDDAALVGEGEMEFDGSGLPTGFEPAGRTVIRSTAALVGDMLTLGDGSSLRGLVIEDVVGRLTGNPVVVSSRDADDFVSAVLVECEIINPNPSGIVPAGPTGRGLVAITRNPNLGLDPPAHEGAEVRVEMRRSIVRSPGDGGIGIFAINFASHAEIRLVLQRNVIGGGLNASGGVSRPDAVTGSSVRIESRRNLYRSDTAVPTPLGWSFFGGTAAPIPGLASAASTFNALQMDSHDDTIDAFATGLSAIGAVRSTAISESASSNRIDLNLHGLHMQTTATDLLLLGARTLVDGVSPGDDNTVRALIRKSTGSGPRANVYADSFMGVGVGNELEIVGTEKSFAKSNHAFDPIPPAEFFSE